MNELPPIPVYDWRKLPRPNCPHCGAAMNFSGNIWENSGCRCWWNGCADGVYTRQVRIDPTDDELISVSVDPDAMRAWIGQRNDQKSARKIERDFDDALSVEKYAADFLAAPDATAKTTVVIDYLYAHDSSLRWTIKNKRGKGMRKLIRRFMEERWSGQSLPETVEICKHYRHLQTNGRDPFAFTP